MARDLIDEDPRLQFHKQKGSRVLGADTKESIDIATIKSQEQVLKVPS